MPKSQSGHRAVRTVSFLSLIIALTTTIQVGKWFDCAECHAEQEDHPLLQSFDMVSREAFFCLSDSGITVDSGWADIHLQEMQESLSEKHEGMGRQVRPWYSFRSSDCI